MNSIFWHDYETTGVSPALDRPLQFAGIRTDEQLNIIGEPVNFYCQPPRDILPHPEACLITGIKPQRAEAEGVPEPAFMAKIHAELAVPGTCGAGYNSIRFDDEVTRYSLYRNFYDPYQREWQGGNSRWDIIDMLRLTHALRPDGIRWPKNEDGSTSFRLELLTVANGISHEAAHDAMSDVYATIAMAKLVKDKQPKLYEYIYQLRTKRQVASLIQVNKHKPFLHVSTRLPRENSYTGLMVPLCMHPRNSNGIIAFNLMGDPNDLLQLTAEQIKARVFTATADLAEGSHRIPLKTIHINRCPIITTPKLLDKQAAERLGIDIGRCEENWLQLKKANLTEKLQAVFTEPEMDRKNDAESALYDGFISNEEKPLLMQVRKAKPEALAVLQSRFQDKRYRELLFRYRARYFADTLSEQEALAWQEQRYQMLTEPLKGRLSIDDYFERIDELDGNASERDRAILASLRDWGDQLLGE